MSLTDLNNEFLALDKSKSPAHLRSYLQARQFLSPDTLKANEEELTSLIDASLEDAEIGLELVKEWNGNVSSYVIAAREHWPEATVFKDQKKTVNGIA